MDREIESKKDEELLMKISNLAKMAYNFDVIVQTYDEVKLFSEFQSIFNDLSSLKQEAEEIMQEAASRDIASTADSISLSDCLDQFFEVANSTKSKLMQRLAGFTNKLLALTQSVQSVTVRDSYYNYIADLDVHESPPYDFALFQDMMQNSQRKPIDIDLEKSVISFLKDENKPIVTENHIVFGVFPHNSDDISAETEYIMKSLQVQHHHGYEKDIHRELGSVLFQNIVRKDVGEEERFSDKKLMGEEVVLGVKFVEGELVREVESFLQGKAPERGFKGKKRKDVCMDSGSSSNPENSFESFY